MATDETGLLSCILQPFWLFPSQLRHSAGFTPGFPQIHLLDPGWADPPVNRKQLEHSSLKRSNGWSG